MNAKPTTSNSSISMESGCQVSVEGDPFLKPASVSSIHFFSEEGVSSYGQPAACIELPALNVSGSNDSFLAVSNGSINSYGASVEARNQLSQAKALQMMNIMGAHMLHHGHNMAFGRALNSSPISTVDVHPVPGQRPSSNGFIELPSHPTHTRYATNIVSPQPPNHNDNRVTGQRTLSHHITEDFGPDFDPNLSMDPSILDVAGTVTYPRTPTWDGMFDMLQGMSTSTAERKDTVYESLNNQAGFLKKKSQRQVSAQTTPVVVKPRHGLLAKNEMPTAKHARIRRCDATSLSVQSGFSLSADREGALPTVQTPPNVEKDNTASKMLNTRQVLLEKKTPGRLSSRTTSFVRKRKPVTGKDTQKHSKPTKIPHRAKHVKNTLVSQKRRNVAAVKKCVEVSKAEIKELDVLCERGQNGNSHAGTNKYRQLVDTYKDEYGRIPDNEKRPLSRKIVLTVLNYGGRFLKKIEKGLYHVMDIEAATTKTMEKLREDKYKTSPEDEELRPKPRLRVQVSKSQHTLELV